MNDPLQSPYIDLENNQESSKPVRQSLTSSNIRPKNPPPIQFSDFYLSDLKRLTTESTTGRVKQNILKGGSPKTLPSLKSGSPLNINKALQFTSKKNMNTEGDEIITQKLIENLPNHIREFFNGRKDFIKIFEDYDKMNFCLESVTERVTCYRYELGNTLKRVEDGFLKTFERLLDQSIKMYTDYRIKGEKQMTDHLQIIDKLEKEKKELEMKNRNLKNLYNFQESEYKICKINSDALQNELVLLHELLKKDVLSLINHLGTIESVNQKGYQLNDPSENLASGLTDLNRLISTLEEEQSNKNNLMGSMNNLLKAMLKGGKQDIATQVDEGELLWKPELILGNAKLDNYQEYKEGLQNPNSNLPINMDLLKSKEKDALITGQIEMKGILGENWNLPISFIVFLENVTKQSESGRVLPWSYFKKIIFEIYNERIKFNWEFRAASINSTMTFDEFICIYFLKVYKLRRMAEIKLLEFLVSLKYYYKLWPRALLFANLIGVAQHTRSIAEPNFSYDFDIFLQDFFFYSYSKIIEYNDSFEENQDGQTLISKDKLEELLGQMLVFETGGNKRFYAKISRYFKKGEDGNELMDIDKLLECVIDEYFEARKRNSRILTKNFSKFYESDHGLFSFEDIKNIISEVTDIETPVKGNLFANDLTKLRLFFFTLTSSKNKYDIINKDFIYGCGKFGIDSPYPFLNVNFNGNENKILQEKIAENNELNKLKRNLGGDLDKKSKKVNIKNEGETEESINKDENVNKAKKNNEDEIEKMNEKGALKIDSSSAMFAQHFSILRELRNYCLQLKDAVKTENDMDTIWKHLDNIVNILDIGCQFLNFPIQL